jgi:hypothetical protein
MERFIASKTVLVILLVMVACQERDGAREGAPPAPWVERSGFDWSHDGNPLFTPHFVIYSDNASQKERRKLALGVEIFLARLTTMLTIDSIRSGWWPDSPNRFAV